MYGNKIKMPAPLMDDLVEYSDGTEATSEQMAKDVTAFMMWGRTSFRNKTQNWFQSNCLFNYTNYSRIF